MLTSMESQSSPDSDDNLRHPRHSEPESLCLFQKTPARLERSPAGDGWCFGIRPLGLEGCLVLAHRLHVGVFAALEGALLGELVAESLRWSMEIFQETCFELRDCC
jgi:hypothetical protein